MVAHRCTQEVEIREYCSSRIPGKKQDPISTHKKLDILPSSYVHFCRKHKQEVQGSGQ
jgi:hypothetical protein